MVQSGLSPWARKARALPKWRSVKLVHRYIVVECVLYLCIRKIAGLKSVPKERDVPAGT